MKLRTRNYMIAGAMLFFGLAVFSLRQADASRAATEQEYMYLPNKTILKHFTVGMSPIIADLLWLECIQYTGRTLRSGDEFTWIEQMVRTATALDPHFMELYHYGGMFLASLKGDGDAAISLLEDGIVDNPESWQLPYEIAMVYLLNRGEEPESKCRAKYYVAMSLRTGQAPGFVSELYEGLQERCGAQRNDPCGDLEFEAQTYQRLFDTGESVMQDVARKKMELLQLRKTCCDLTGLLELYKRGKGEMPGDLNMLVDAGLLQEMPQDPKGGAFFIDSDGVVKNTTVLDAQVAKFKTNIESGIKNYHKKNGTYPATLYTMLEDRTITYLPPHPYASKTWDYDPATGTIK